MQQNFSLNLRVHFKVKSIAAHHPPHAFFPNSKSCRAFSEFISKTILERVANGSLSVWGKVGEVSPPHLVIPSPLNLQNPACAMMKDFSTCGSKIFRSPWILLLTSPVTSITILSKPRAMTKVGMTMSVFRQTVGHTSVFSGMDGTLFLILSPLDGSYIRSQGVPCSQYVDDRHFGELQIWRTPPPCSWSGFQPAQAALYIACYILIDLGYFICHEKSTLLPTQTPIFLGYSRDSLY